MPATFPVNLIFLDIITLTIFKVIKLLIIMQSYPASHHFLRVWKVVFTMRYSHYFRRLKSRTWCLLFLSQTIVCFTLPASLYL